MPHLTSWFAAAGLAAVATCSAVCAQTPLTPSFTYQGQLKQNGQPVSGLHSMTFCLFDASGGGNQIGDCQTTSVSISGGLFTVLLNAGGEFGQSAFDGNERWLEIWIGNSVLSPRQAITASPYAAWSAAPWITSPNGIYYNGRVGIGTSSPQGTFVVAGNENGSLGITINNSSSGGSAETLLAIQSASAQFSLYAKGLGGRVGIQAEGNASALDFIANGANQPIRFFTGGGDGSNRRVQIQPNGNVGIGTTDPEVRLHVAGTTRTGVLEIVGGSDLAEPFPVSGTGRIEPGMLVSIDAEHPGQLMLCTHAYDRTVAGVVSGANGINAGLTMKQAGTIADGTLPIALSGRVYCWCDADAGGEIQPGDLLTSSDTPGHAIRVTDHARARGAVIGKAMERLEGGRGLVLVLVSLQ
jgi:hypothetical protein